MVSDISLANYDCRFHNRIRCDRVRDPDISPQEARVTERYTVLVTSEHLVSEAQQILRDAGARIEFMSEPITESTLADRLAAKPVDAILLRGSKPLTARVLSAG